MSSSAAPNDKTANKVALCSAVFAGFAYVGYNIVRTAFAGKKGKREVESIEPGENRLYFRRLSQTTQTDVLLGNLDVSGSGKVILRSRTVQERIRELNLRARMFADTMLAIKGSSRLPHPRHVTAKSLQASPWSSPRILSPVDVQHIMSTRSNEELHLLGDDLDFYNDSPSPIRKRLARRSFRQKSPSSGCKSRSRSRENNHGHDKEIREAEHLFTRNKDLLIKDLDYLSTKYGTKISSHEAQILVALLHSKDEITIEKSLTVIGNLGTFEYNQNVLRNAGCLVLLSKYITYHKSSVRLAAITTLGNLALNRENQVELKDTIPKLISMLKHDNIKDELAHCILTTLTNFAVLTDCHGEFFPVLHSAYDFIDKKNESIQLQSLKLLINLSCNEDMVPSLLAVQGPRKLTKLLDLSVDESLLLRIVTLLSRLTYCAKDMELDPARDLPPEDKAASPDTMYAAIYGVNSQDRLQSRLLNLINKHPNEEIRNHCKKILDLLNN